MKKIKYQDLSKIEKSLLLEAEGMLEKSYNPYSHFAVGAAILTSDNQMIGGANVENAAYGSCLCAERSALLRANAMGCRSFLKIAIIARSEKTGTAEATAPCGSCRQMIYEFAQLAGKDIEIIMANTKKNKIVKAKISELLPMAFGPKDLGVNLKKFI
ncbi:MAG: cytidine deaminase [Candidatus Falkowbacteria bacterium]